MRNVISRVLAVTFLVTLTAACCKNTPPAATAAAAPAATAEQAVVAAESASASAAATAEGAAAASAVGATEASSAPVAAGQPASEAASRAAPAGGSGRPETKEACAACKGKWGRHGLAKEDSCICRTKDGGKPCLDGADCQGHCVAKESDFVVVQKGPPPKGHYKGTCSEFDAVFGCHRFVPKGARKKGPQLAEDAADQLCYD